MLLALTLLGCSDKGDPDLQREEPPFVPVVTFSEETLVLTGGYADPSVAPFEERYTLYASLTEAAEGADIGTLAFSSEDLVTWTPDPNGVIFLGVATGRALQMDDGVRFFYPSTGPVADGTVPTTSGGISIYSAWSNDSVHFVDDPGLRTTSDEGDVGGPTLIELDDGTWRAFYHVASGKAADGEIPSASIWAADSDNGLDWDLEEEPVLEASKDVEGVDPTAQLLHPFVTPGPDAEGTPEAGYWMFYNSHDIMYAAYSDDAADWDRLGPIGLEAADFDAIAIGPNQWRVWYGRYAEDTRGEIYTAIMNISISNE